MQTTKKVFTFMPTGMFKAIPEQITYLYKEKRQPLLLAIDEAQYMNTGILNDIRMLMNYGYDSVNYFTLILCGESHLNDTLRKPVHEELRQRITVHYNYVGLTDDEVSRYILHKLQLAGASTPCHLAFYQLHQLVFALAHCSVNTCFPVISTIYFFRRLCFASQ